MRALSSLKLIEDPDMFQVLRFALTICLITLPATARADLVDRYFEALQMPEVFSILRKEGISAGEDLTQFGGDISASPAWSARLAGIYSMDEMRAEFRSQLTAVDDLEASIPAIEFFETELGRRIVNIELAARRAMADDEIMAALREQVSQMEDDGEARLDLYAEFIRINELVDSNVSGALNSNLAFYRGMATSEQFSDTLSESYMLTTVWGQEPEIREETESWTMNFSTLAYAELSDAEMQQYIDVSASEAGQKLNAALFAGFDKVFETQSFDLGRATAEFSIGEDT